MPHSRLNWLVLVALVVSVPTLARSAEITDVLDAFDGDTTWQGTLGVRYVHTQKRATLLREWICQADNALGSGSGTSQLCPSGNAVLDTNQLAFSESKNVLNLDLRAGLWHDLQLSITLPVVVGWTSELSYAGGVDGGNSLVAGELIPSLFNVPYSSASRVGIGDLVIGLAYAPITEARNPGLPSWVIGVDYTAPTAEARSAGSKGVGSGLHTLFVHTAISRRVGIVDPYFELGGTLRFSDSNGPFKNERTTQTLVSPGHSIAARIGTEIAAWNQPSEVSPYVSVDVGVRAGITFKGREFTELFDALGSSACDPRGGCTRTTLARGERGQDGRLRKTDGVTDVEQYADLGANVAVTYRPMEHLKVSLGFDYDYTTEHYITFADAGRDLDGNGNVDAQNSQGMNEYNPFYNEAYDTYGRRFRVADKHAYTIMFTVEGQL